jgi:predicted O-linked N-acetylglucosamine transferase (SPINDLY family)
MSNNIVLNNNTLKSLFTPIKVPLTLENVLSNIEITKKIYDAAQEKLSSSSASGTPNIDTDAYNKCLEYSNQIITFLDQLNPFQMNRIKKDVKTIYYISAEILVRTVGLHMNRPNGFQEREKGILFTAIAHLQKVLNVDPFDPSSKELFKIVMIYLTIFNPNPQENLQLLKNILMVNPCDYQVHYNLGFMYQRANDLENALSHFKLALGILDLEIRINEEKLLNDSVKIAADNTINALKQFQVKCLNGLGGIYFAIQDRELANYFFYKALDILPNDPDINNQVGVVYTELRYTDKAIYHYKKGIENYKLAHISTDLDMLLASMHMNMGLAYCYEINYPEAISCYNQALKYKPRLSLAYQNKLLDLNYISHLIEDPMYIANLHKNINKIYPLVINNWKEGCPKYKINQLLMNSPIVNGKVDKKALVGKTKINIGFVTGDAICHPVSYFVSCIFKFVNYDLFNITVYSLKVVNLSDQYPECNFKIVKGTSPEELKAIIQKDNIDILFDLASQTGDNRLDTFVLKPAPIQISYCGYPNTSGLSNMDYHIVDHYCDSDGVTPGPGGIVRPSTQKYYTEKLLFMPNCFLSYTPSIGIENLPVLVDTQPVTKNGYLTIGTFNRYNKINDRMVELWERILQRCTNVRFIIKTKEFLTETLKQQFIKTWKDPEVFKRVEIVDYRDTYTQHLVDYNLMDISIDTAPYSGTTTSTESLMMGVPVLTRFDGERQYHATNVSSSLMINSDLPEYVCLSDEELIEKVEYFSTHLEELKDLKKTVRNKFVNGPICNYKQFVSDLEDLLLNTYKLHSW